MFTPFRLIARVPYHATNWFQGFLKLLQSPRFIVGNGALLRILLGFLGKENALLPVKNQVVDYFFFGFVDVFGAAEHKFGDERDGEQFFNLQFSPIGTRNLWSGLPPLLRRQSLKARIAADGIAIIPENDNVAGNQRRYDETIEPDEVGSLCCNCWD